MKENEGESLRKVKEGEEEREEDKRWMKEEHGGENRKEEK